MNYRSIDYPSSLSAELRERYEKLADAIEATATEPIAILWAYEDVEWTDEHGVNPERNCLLVTQHIQDGDESEWTFGRNISTHRIY